MSRVPSQVAHSAILIFICPNDRLVNTAECVVIFRGCIAAANLKNKLRLERLRANEMYFFIGDAWSVCKRYTIWEYTTVYLNAVYCNTLLVHLNCDAFQFTWSHISATSRCQHDEYMRCASDALSWIAASESNVRVYIFIFIIITMCVCLIIMNPWCTWNTKLSCLLVWLAGWLCVSLYGHPSKWFGVAFFKNANIN